MILHNFIFSVSNTFGLALHPFRRGQAQKRKRVLQDGLGGVNQHQTGFECFGVVADDAEGRGAVAGVIERVEDGGEVAGVLD